MTVIIDNYDSFTYNLAHMINELGEDIIVLRNDQFQLNELMKYDKIILSPGPGIPQEAGLLLAVIHQYAGIKPILGVCLGEQAIGEVFGARLKKLQTVYHGVQSEITLYADSIFQGLPNKIVVGRYHSWAVDTVDFPSVLEITALSDEGIIMGLKHRQYNIHGIQFHPESVLTPFGKNIMQNFLKT